MPKLIVFDVGSTFGYFRKPFTTTNALTHSVIPRSAVEGMIGAILGMHRDQYSQQLQESNIAVEIRSPVRKLALKYMHINHEWFDYISHYLQNRDNNQREITQKVFTVPVSVEFLRNPNYRIYIDDEKINEKLIQHLENKQTYYTPFLGTSSMICYLHYVKTTTYRPVSSKHNKYVPLNSIVPFSRKVPKVRLERDVFYAIEDGLTIHLDNQRVSSGTYKILYSPEMSQLEVADEEDLIEFEINGIRTYVKFLPTKVAS